MDNRLAEKIKLVVADIDGTLYNHKHRLTDVTRDAIRRLVAKGYTFALASGRNVHDAQQIIADIGVNAYLICSNGACVYDSDMHKIFELDIPTDYVKELIHMPKVDGVHVNMYQGKSWLIDEEETVFSAFYEEGYLLPKIVNLSEYEDNPTDKVFFTTLDKKKLNPLAKEVHRRLGNKVKTTYSMNRCFEVTHQDANKGNAIIQVAKHMEIELEEIMVFGNGYNDYEMLKFAGKSYLMGNSPKDLIKSLPQAEVIRKNSEDGVAMQLIEVLEL